MKAPDRLRLNYVLVDETQTHTEFDWRVVEAGGAAYVRLTPELLALIETAKYWGKRVDDDQRVSVFSLLAPQETLENAALAFARSQSQDHPDAG